MSPALPPRPPGRRRGNTAWMDRLFAAEAVRRGGIVRRAVRDVEREIGRDQLELEVRRRGFHLVEVAGQFVIICTPGQLRVIC